MTLLGDVAEGWTGPLDMAAAAAAAAARWAIDWEEEGAEEWGRERETEGADGLGPEELERWKEGPPLSWRKIEEIKQLNS